MGMAKLNIWVSEFDNPCGVDDTHNWFITIYDCDGNVLNWCGRRYVVMPAKCGHLEVEVPPGVYYIKAVWSFRPGVRVFWVNHFTDAAIVQAICDKTVCVKLFNPSAHRCGAIYLQVVKNLLTNKLITQEEADNAENALNKVLKSIPRPKKMFELQHIDALEQMIKEQKTEEKAQ